MAVDGFSVRAGAGQGRGARTGRGFRLNGGRGWKSHRAIHRNTGEDRQDTHVLVYMLV